MRPDSLYNNDRGVFMTTNEIRELIGDFPIIAAIKDDSGLEQCLNSDCQIVFVLYGSINSIAGIVHQLKDGGKTVFVHSDLIEGLSAQEAAVDYLIAHTSLDGIISTKMPLLRFAKAKGLTTILRFFVIDSLALQNISKVKNERSVDFIEILPGLMPKVTASIVQATGKDVITGGLITEKGDVMTSLDAGACGVSTTNQKVWFM